VLARLPAHGEDGVEVGQACVDGISSRGACGGSPMSRREAPDGREGEPLESLHSPLAGREGRAVLLDRGGEARAHRKRLRLIV